MVSGAITSHHQPLDAPPTHLRLAAITYLANVLAYRIGSGFGFPEYVVSPDPAVLAYSTSYEQVRADLKEISASA